jgi:hypothetical protein
MAIGAPASSSWIFVFFVDLRVLSRSSWIFVLQ